MLFVIYKQPGILGHTMYSWNTAGCQYLSLAVIGVNGPAVVKGMPPEVSRMDEKAAPNRATEKPVEESFSSPGVEWNINGKTRKPRNPAKGKVIILYPGRMQHRF